uniref:Uncharacterized protein n=1 Tax=Amphiprion ocellaris TaxID=80972 RepID=A0A3Q1BVA8_AMPOC
GSNHSQDSYQAGHYFCSMLKRTKYSRLRNDSLTSLEDHPQRMLPLKGDFCLDSDFAQLDPGTPAHQGASTLRDFIPRVANIRLQSPISLRGLRGQTGRDRAVSSKPSSRTERFCSHPSFTRALPEQRANRSGAGQSHVRLYCACSPVYHFTLKSESNWCFVVFFQYMGSVEVTQSMRTLNFNTRMQVTR